MNFIDDKKIFKKSNLATLINICLKNEFDYIEASLRVWLQNDDNDLSNYREALLDIGALCSGIVYTQRYSYRLAGFILKRKRKIKAKEDIDYFFMPVYIEGNINLEDDPYIFNNCCNIYDDNGFVSDSFGNFIYLDTIIETKECIENYVKRKSIDLNSFLKNNGIYFEKNTYK